MTPQPKIVATVTLALTDQGQLGIELKGPAWLGAAELCVRAATQCFEEAKKQKQNQPKIVAAPAALLSGLLRFPN